VSARTRAAAAAAVLLLSACGDQPGFDPQAVEDFLVSSQQSRYQPGDDLEAVCPYDLKLEEGMTFACTLTASGTDIPYRVQLTRVREADPTVQVETAALVVPETTVQIYVVSSLPATARGAKLDCGSSYVVVEAGDDFMCYLSLGGQQREVTLTADEQGAVTIADSRLG